MADQKNIYERTEISKWLYRHSKIGISGRFVCDKSKNPLHFRSYLELGCLRYIALDKSIAFMDSQIGTMKWLPRTSPVLRNYTPDILTCQTCGSITFVEVKPNELLKGAEKERLNQIKIAYARAGYGFKTLTDEDVPYEMFVNTGHILNAPIHRFEDGFLRLVADSISATLPSKFTLYQLREFLSAFSLDICDYSLFKSGLLTFNMKELITPNTLIWRA
ncbi:hypothetical protein [Paraglaciecola chathamensis]|uniref:hypothetical protein n=1 Tax=Paraglaciecola chathamensis TaxID=368405 RepID=UPI0026FBF9C7|nr:hypothetical protein [Paraglaciecola chathamensis]MDO6557627.1 hypothetical protein [Paraglaciecola chathamensis]